MKEVKGGVKKKKKGFLEESRKTEKKKKKRTYKWRRTLKNTNIISDGWFFTNVLPQMF